MGSLKNNMKGISAILLRIIREKHCGYIWSGTELIKEINKGLSQYKISSPRYLGLIFKFQKVVIAYRNRSARGKLTYILVLRKDLNTFDTEKVEK